MPAADTTFVCTRDRQGNVFAASPSDPSYDTVIIPGTGLCPSSRGTQSWADPKHPSSVQPGKRPRLTPNPAIALRDGAPFLVFGTPGGDSQEQLTLQFFLNYVEFDMNIQEALEAPTVRSHHFPSSFYPRAAHPRRMIAEARIPGKVIAELARRGHEVELTGAWSGGKVLAIHYNISSGVIVGGASPKGNIGYAIGW